MSTFVNRIKDRYENDRSLSHVDYGGFRRMGYLRAVTVRLPVTTIAKMKLLEERCPELWESKQEMLFEMIESSIQDWIDQQSSPKLAHEDFQALAHRVLQLTPPQRPGKVTASKKDEL